MRNLNGKYVGFYLKKLIWAGSIPDFDAMQYDLHENFNKIMEEVVFVLFSERLEIAVCRDGLILIKYAYLEGERDGLVFEPAEKKRFNIDGIIDFYLRYLKIINVFQNVLASCMDSDEEAFLFHPANFSVHEIMPFRFSDGKFQGASYGDNIMLKYIHTARYASTYLTNNFNDFKAALNFDPRIVQRRSVLSESVFSKAFGLIDKILLDDILFNIMNGFCGAISENAAMNYNQSLVQSWFVIEGFINAKWEQYFLASNGFMGSQLSKNRKEFLKGRDFTASIMSNILEIQGLIDTDIFNKMDVLRKKRNAIAHNLKDKSARLIAANREDCQNAFEVINHFIKTDYGISLTTNYGFQVSGV